MRKLRLASHVRCLTKIECLSPDCDMTKGSSPLWARALRKNYVTTVDRCLDISARGRGHFDCRGQFVCYV